MPDRRNDGDGMRQMVTGRRALVLVLVAGAVLFSGTQAEARGKPSYGCSPGFDLGALTLEQGLELPRIEAGLAAGVYDEAALESKFNAVDHNGDGLICFQDFFAIAGERPNPASLLQFNYNVVDNNASAP
jgi:hypothetical protein